MPMHDWTRVDEGLYHAFHDAWISELSRALNGSVLPDDYYALPEQQSAAFTPEALNATSRSTEGANSASRTRPIAATLTRTRPQTRSKSETPTEFYLRKQKSVAIRHVKGDRLLALIEIVSPGNKESAQEFGSFVEKACRQLEACLHLLLIDPFPPGACDPQGVHAAIWEKAGAGSFELPVGKPLTLVSYECDQKPRARVEPIAVGDRLPDLPLFLEPGKSVLTPLEATYCEAFAVMPRRWRNELE